MQRIQYDAIYLAACGVNRLQPSPEFLMELRRKQERKEMVKTKTGQEVPYMEMLHCMSRAHFLDALVGTVLKEADITLPKKWMERISKAVRKNLLFDVERKKLLDFMEQRGIWYMPLKGVVLKDYYPAVGMRQMSDNDILFDESYCDEIEQYMKSQGYEVVSVGVGNHDVYEKKPVYNFEMHRALYGAVHDRNWEEYYRDVKKRLIPDSGSSYGYHFSDEDFYVYILCHAYKHYAGGGTGLRSLLDFYVYLTAKEQSLDFDYIRKECEVLGIKDFEEQSRSLCKKVFSATYVYNMEAFEQSLSPEEMEMLCYYLTSGVYGTFERSVENRIRKNNTKSGKHSKLGYIMNRLFPGKEILQYYPFFNRHKWLLPVCWLYRLVRMCFDKERRTRTIREINVVKLHDKRK